MTVLVNVRTSVTVEPASGYDWPGYDWPGYDSDDEEFGYEPEPPTRREELLAELIRVMDQHRGLFDALGDR
jgi:hypothetical protein